MANTFSAIRVSRSTVCPIVWKECVGSRMFSHIRYDMCDDKWMLKIMKSKNAEKLERPAAISTETNLVHVAFYSSLGGTWHTDER